MLKRFQRQESLAIGELALFLATWLLTLATTLNDYNDRSDAKNSVASIEGQSEDSSSLD